MKLSPELIAKASDIQSITEFRLRQIEKYCNALLEANRKINLVSRAGNVEKEIESQLLLSLGVLRKLVPIAPKTRWLDVGSGGGFPAIPLAILCSDTRFDLIESVQKKAFFLERTSLAIGLTNVRVVNRRMSDVLKTPREIHLGYDFLSAKAAGSTKEKFEWARGVLRSGGTFITFESTVARQRDSTAVTCELQPLDSFAINDVDPNVTARILLYKKS